MFSCNFSKILGVFFSIAKDIAFNCIVINDYLSEFINDRNTIGLTFLDKDLHFSKLSSTFLDFAQIQIKHNKIQIG